jgi:peptidoglycan/LPS O-acetylase OafA/YrhL
MADVRPAPTERREFLPSIALMRALAALAVVYDHLVGIWFERSGATWRPAQFLDTWLFEPFHIMAHGGALAVAVFFLVSGFVIVYVGERESRRSFAIRRALRIFPPLWVSILLLLGAHLALAAFGGANGVQEYAVAKVLSSPNPLQYIAAAMTLVNYIIGTPPVNGVAWTLIIEVMFYAVVFTLLPVLRTRPRTAIVAAVAMLAGLQVIAKANGVVFLIAVNSVYVCYLFLGSLIYLRWAGRIGNRFLLAGSVAFAALFLHGLRAYVVQPPFTFTDYGVSYTYAWLIFVGIVLLNERIRLGAVTDFFSRISYSLYLNHGGLGLLALAVLVPRLGYSISLMLAFAMVVGISTLSHRWVEVPSQRWARRLTAKRAPAPPSPGAPG